MNAPRAESSSRSRVAIMGIDPSALAGPTGVICGKLSRFNTARADASAVAAGGVTDVVADDVEEWVVVGSTEYSRFVEDNADGAFLRKPRIIVCFVSKWDDSSGQQRPPLSSYPISDNISWMSVRQLDTSMINAP